MRIDPMPQPRKSAHSKTSEKKLSRKKRVSDLESKKDEIHSLNEIVNQVLNQPDPNISEEKKKESKTKIRSKSKSKSKSKPKSKSKSHSKSVDSDDLKREADNIDIKAYHDARKFLEDNGIKISTITMNCSLGVVVNINSFAKYVVLDEDGILSVKHGDRKNPATNRTIIPLKKKQSKRNFFNQVTIFMKPKNSSKINIKVFNNGSLHFTGCKNIDDFVCVTDNLIKILLKGVNIKGKNGENRHIRFINKSDINKIRISNTKIRMINSNFKLQYKVDRKKLAYILKKNHNSRTTDREIGYVDFKHKPNGGHSCVNIKYRYDNKSQPSIFVFQTGSIIITGAKTFFQIISAYHYIHMILKKYISQIKIIELDPLQVNEAINNFYVEKRKTIDEDELSDFEEELKWQKNIIFSPSKKGGSKRGLLLNGEKPRRGRPPKNGTTSQREMRKAKGTGKRGRPRKYPLPVDKKIKNDTIQTDEIETEIIQESESKVKKFESSKIKRKGIKTQINGKNHAKMSELEDFVDGSDSDLNSDLDLDLDLDLDIEIESESVESLGNKTGKLNNKKKKKTHGSKTVIKKKTRDHKSQNNKNNKKHSRKD